MRGTLVSILLASVLLLPVSTSQAVIQGPELPRFDTTAEREVPVRTEKERGHQVGAASFYHSWFDGRKTASGATFSSRLFTAAHRSLEFGTRVRVTNLVNLKSVIVTINDRGPFVKGRVIDLSRRAATALGFVREGVTRVRIEPLTSAPPARSSAS